MSAINNVEVKLIPKTNHSPELIISMHQKTGGLAKASATAEKTNKAYQVYPPQIYLGKYSIKTVHQLLCGAKSPDFYTAMAAGGYGYTDKEKKQASSTHGGHDGVRDPVNCLFIESVNRIVGNLMTEPGYSTTSLIDIGSKFQF